MRLGKIMIFVTDLDEAKSFYCDILGFSLRSETYNRLDFIHEGCDFIAYKCDKNSIVRDYSNEARSVFVFEVEEVDRQIEELRNAGVIFLHNEAVENEFSRYAAFSDPFGNIHEIFEAKEILKC